MDIEKDNEKQLLNEKSTLREVLSHFPTKTALALELGEKGKPLTRQAITNMNMDAPLSQLNYLTLRFVSRPELYEQEGTAA